MPKKTPQTRALQVCRIGILLTMDPTLHWKMKAEEACDGSSDGLQTRHEHKNTGKQEHRNRPLSALIVNIETDVQAE